MTRQLFAMTGFVWLAIGAECFAGGQMIAAAAGALLGTFAIVGALLHAN